MKVLNFYSLKYILILFPLLLLSGPFLPDLFLSLISLAYIHRLIVKKAWVDFFSKSYNKFFLLFYVIIVTSSLVSEFQLYSLKSSFFYIRYLFFFNAIIELLDNDPKIINKLSILTLIVLTIVSFDVFFQSLLGFNIIGYQIDNGSRIGSFFGDELIVGSYLSRLLPLMVIFFISFDYLNQKKKIFFFFILFVGFAIFFSGERTAFFIYLITLFFTFFIKKLRIVILISTIILVFFTFIFSYTNKNLRERMFSQTINQIYDKKTNSIYFFSKEHTILSLISIDLFKKNKFFGIGVKNFRNICDDSDYENLVSFTPDHYCNFHPHNIFFQFLSETGIFGAVMYLFFLVYLITIIYKIIIQTFKENINNYYNIALFLSVGILISIFPLLPSGQFFNNWLSVYLFLYLGLFFGLKKKLNN